MYPVVNNSVEMVRILMMSPYKLYAVSAQGIKKRHGKFVSATCTYVVRKTRSVSGKKTYLHGLIKKKEPLLKKKTVTVSSKSSPRPPPFSSIHTFICVRACGIARGLLLLICPIKGLVYKA